VRSKKIRNSSLKFNEHPEGGDKMSKIGIAVGGGKAFGISLIAFFALSLAALTLAYKAGHNKNQISY